MEGMMQAFGNSSNSMLSAWGFKPKEREDEELEETKTVKTVQEVNAESMLGNLHNNINFFFDKLELNEDVLGIDYILLLRALCHNTTVRFLTIGSSFLGSLNTDEEVRILLEIAASMPKLETLRVTFVREMAMEAKVVSDIIGRTSMLKELHLVDLELPGDDYDMESLGEVLEKLTSLKSFSMLNLGLEEAVDESDPITPDHIVNSLSGLPALEHVEITMRRKFLWEGDSLGVLCDSSTLKSLKLENMTLSIAQVASIASSLNDNTTLTSLQLRHCGLDDECWRAVASILPENGTLQHLDLSQNDKLDDDGCFVIGSCLEGNTAMKTLKLYNDEGSEVTSRGVTSLFRMVEKNSALECLEMSYTASDAVGFKSVADALVRNSSLKRLYVENHGKAVSTTGVVAIARALESGNQGLEEIAIIFDGIDNDGVLALAKAVEKNSTLKHFTFNRAEYRRAFKPAPPSSGDVVQRMSLMMTTDL
ncbi:NLR family, CARD domain containing 3 [Seminavis robusta]|uniref:NLR family, CARD domain containing 3 n=1 Tax=Seminavis robusta TaxID=568900 RepID=A0A9N8ES65_9STRA|nr:NLR family, CARD domain containing 3 [Seminavis robusta]|eukprot:Sro1533_g280360.1 NLR family, CARD domain containing 3 (479) ;mRNA; f:14211-15762